jgi:DNA-binding CsgD family transcriptional regulator/PAS domain-containing protein
MTHGVSGFTTPEPQKRAREGVGQFPLTRRDHEALHDAFAVLLTPLDFVDAEHWRGEVGKVLSQLLRADRSAFRLDIPGAPVLYSEDYPQATLDAYAEHYHAVDLGRIRREELGLEVWNRWRLHGAKLRQFWESEIHRDFLAPNKIFDSMGITIGVAGARNPATLFFHSEKPGTPEFGERGVSLLSLVLPAFKAGVRDLVRYSHQRESLAAHLDSLSEGIRICDLRGNTVHQNPAFSAAIALEREPQKLERAIFDVVHALIGFSNEQPSGNANVAAAAGHRLTRQVSTSTAAYQIGGTFLGRELLGAELRIVVTLIRLAAQTTLSDSALQEKYNLTGRELEIARRLAYGQSTKEVAQACGISLHTARRHTEKIFQKLGVRNRSQVGPKLRAG